LEIKKNAEALGSLEGEVSQENGEGRLFKI